ncbi:major facilitator superfamily domain-containing protein [Fusarium redolens]|uniref:Major facilitator superfamily domain-containing protein n=1 Tax=Fusarium redolens TaxID=48865 RepID=A0A9P9HCI9_FUSRE|nr:major facilitator superfamily domain-containing protein [Fusarium redolens]KAH7255169.1 major facilitator superfamily domain-containing protein [Fusarium redolens]
MTDAEGNTTTVEGQECRHRATISPEPCQDCKRESNQQVRYRWRIILGLVLPFALSALDVTIIASALPWIAADFDRVTQLNWIIAAFNLTAAAFIPFWGQMADIFGRHSTIQACMILALIGGGVCTGTPHDAFPMLLFGRALQGIGCAGMNVVIRAIVADKVPLREDAYTWSIFSLVGGCSYAIGPVVGGYLTKTTWRWCFGINLPIGAAGCVVVFVFLRPVLLGPQPLPQLEETTSTGCKSTMMQRLVTIDASGQILCLLGFGLLVLAFTWAGATYDWDTPSVLVPLIAGFLIIFAFIWWQREMEPAGRLAKLFPRQRAMIPWQVIKTRDIGLLFTSFASGMAMYAVMYFCSLYFTMVKHLPANEAGRALLFFVPGIAVGVCIAIFMCNNWPRQTWHPIMAGSIIEAVAIALLAWAMWEERDGGVYGMMAMAGVGVGVRFMPVPLHGMGFFPQQISAIVSLSQLSDPLGGTLGLTIMTTVFNNINLPPEAIAGIQETAKEGIVWAFIAIFPFMILCIVAAALMGSVYLTTGAADEDDNANQIYEGVYLWALLRKEKIDRNSDKVKVTHRATLAGVAGRSSAAATAPWGQWYKLDRSRLLCQVGKFLPSFKRLVPFERPAAVEF